MHIVADRIMTAPRCDLEYIDVTTPRPEGYFPQVWCDGQKLKYCISAMPKAGMALLAADEGIGRLIENRSTPDGTTWLIGGEIAVTWEPFQNDPR